MSSTSNDKEDCNAIGQPKVVDPCCYYFAYGSNLDAKRMTDRVGSFMFREPAETLPGWRLSFNKPASSKGEGYATIHRDEDGDISSNVVEGAAYQISLEQLSILDGYEGVKTGHYRRQEIILRIKSNEDNKSRQEVAWVYIAKKSSSTTLKPSWEYLCHLLRGSDVLSPAYRTKLQMWPSTMRMANTASTFFVYGSLRPDYNMGMPWTRTIKDKTVAQPAILRSARLYDDQYACAVLGSGALPNAPIGSLDRTIRRKDQIVGFALRPRIDQTSLEDLLRELDKIEGYPHLYQRDVVPIVLEEDGTKHMAYVYHRPDCCKERPVPTGNWMERER